MKLQQLFILPVICLLPTTGSAQSQPTKSITFNGTDQYIRIPHHADFNCETNEDLTVTAWVSIPNWNSADQRFISKRAMSYQGIDRSGYEVWGGTATNKFFAINTPNADGNHNNSVSAWSSQSGAQNVWTHIAFVVDRTSGIIKMYQNGSLVGSSGTKNISGWGCTNTFDVLLGAGWDTETSVAKYSNSSLANVRFYRAALSADELAADKNTLEYASLSADMKGKSVAAYDFTGVTGYNLPDLSGQGHNGTFVNFPPVVAGPLEVIEDHLIQDVNFTGRGNDNEVILHSQITVGGEEESANLSAITVTLDGSTQISDIAAVKIYSTGLNANFDSRDPQSISGAVLLGSSVAKSGNIEIPLTGTITAGINHLWITCQIEPDATEGNKVDATLVSLTTDHQTYPFSETTVDGSREIMLGRKLLFAHGDKANAADVNTNYYRIPALLTAKDGSIVAVTDRRKNTINDLPADIDIVFKRSTDGGKTWSETAVIATGKGEGAGFGDAALVQTNEENGLMCVFAGGPGLWTSRAGNPIRIYRSKSNDNGATWDTPVDITHFIYGAECADATRSQWQALFLSSGAGLKMSNGRIGFVGNALPSVTWDASYIANMMIYTDDDGETWNVSNIAKQRNGNEAKLVELNDGRVLMSIRNQAKGSRFYTVSSDKGVTWSTVSSWNEMSEPGCNGDIIRYTSVNAGYEKNRLLHSVPDHDTSRENVSLYISYDEGQSWPVKKSICPTGSAYSSLCVLPDGTIGAFVEENYNTTPYNMYFVNFSLHWLSSGTDTYIHPDASVEVVETPSFSIEEGFYQDAQTLEIKCNTPDAKIYYTLDGTLPTENSTLYVEPLFIQNTTTVKAIAIKEGMANSMIFSAKIEIYEAAYCVWEGGDRSPGDRYLTQLTFTGATVEGAPVNLTVPVSPNGGQTKVYVDRTEYELNCSVGDEITIGFTKYMLEWMHFYAYVDYDHDFVFNTEADELVSFSYYNGVDSKGTPRASSYCPASIPAFTIPATAKPGKTRLRFNVDWNSINPCGQNDGEGGKINTNRGSIIDIVINIRTASESSVSISLPAAGGSITVKEGDNTVVDGQKIALGTILTVDATPEKDYALKSILVNGVAIEGNTFEVKDPITEISAEFEKITYPLTIGNVAGGTLSVFRNYNQDTFEGEPLESSADLISGETVVITFDPKDMTEADKSKWIIFVNDNEYSYNNVDAENGPLYPNDGDKAGYLMRHLVDGPLNLSVSIAIAIPQHMVKPEAGYYDQASNMFVLTKKSTLSILNVNSVIVLEAASSVNVAQLPAGIYVAIIEGAEGQSIVKFVK